MTFKYLREHIHEYISPLDYFNTYVVGVKEGVKELSDSYPSTICPFHHDTDPSFHWWKKKNRFICFGKCGWSGDLVKLHQSVRNVFYEESLSIEEALKSLLKLYDMSDLLDEDAHELSPLEQRMACIDPKRYKVGKQTFTFCKFKELNDNIKIQYRTSKDMDDTIRQYAMLDGIAALVTSGMVTN